MFKTLLALLPPLLLASAAPVALAQDGQVTPNCAKCVTWNAPKKPFRIYGNTWYVGVGGLSSILITGPQGDILIDGDLNESAPQIAKHIQALGLTGESLKPDANACRIFAEVARAGVEKRLADEKAGK